MSQNPPDTPPAATSSTPGSPSPMAAASPPAAAATDPQQDAGPPFESRERPQPLRLFERSASQQGDVQQHPVDQGEGTGEATAAAVVAGGSAAQRLLAAAAAAAPGAVGSSGLSDCASCADLEFALIESLECSDDGVLVVFSASRLQSVVSALQGIDPKQLKGEYEEWVEYLELPQAAEECGLAYPGALVVRPFKLSNGATAFHVPVGTRPGGVRVFVVGVGWWGGCTDDPSFTLMRNHTDLANFLASKPQGRPIAHPTSGKSSMLRIPTADEAGN